MFVGENLEYEYDLNRVVIKAHYETKFIMISGMLWKFIRKSTKKEQK